MSYLSLLPKILPLAIPVLEKIVGNSGHKQLVDMLKNNMPLVQGILGTVADNVEIKGMKTNNNMQLIGELMPVIEMLMKKIPDAENKIDEKDRLEKLEIQMNNVIDELVNLRKQVAEIVKKK